MVIKKIWKDTHYTGAVDDDKEHIRYLTKDEKYNLLKKDLKYDNYEKLEIKR